MSLKFRLTPLAVADLENIWNYIAADNREAADRVEGAILMACERLAENPQMGSQRTDLKVGSRVRFWTVPRYPNYRLVYYPDSNPLQVIAILHGKRDLRRIMPLRDSE